jgi:nucleotide-binding universal stress UspA family protein
MFKQILLPIDLTDRHGPALETAAGLAEQSGGVVVLLHVIEVVAGLLQDEMADFYKQLDKKARHHLRGLGAFLDRRAISWRLEVCCGKRATEVVRFAADSGMDLIGLTAPRLDPNNLGASWGSLSYKIGVLSSCPVLLVK